MHVKSADSLPISKSFYGNVSNPILLDNLNCRGGEEDLLQCTHNGIGVHNCDSSANAGVKCEGMQEFYY